MLPAGQSDDGLNPRVLTHRVQPLGSRLDAYDVRCAPAPSSQHGLSMVTGQRYDENASTYVCRAPRRVPENVPGAGTLALAHVARRTHTSRGRLSTMLVG